MEALVEAPVEAPPWRAPWRARGRQVEAVWRPRKVSPMDEAGYLKRAITLCNQPAKLQ